MTAAITKAIISPCSPPQSWPTASNTPVIAASKKVVLRLFHINITLTSLQVIRCEEVQVVARSRPVAEQLNLRDGIRKNVVKLFIGCEQVTAHFCSEPYIETIVDWVPVCERDAQRQVSQTGDAYKGWAQALKPGVLSQRLLRSQHSADNPL